MPIEESFWREVTEVLGIEAHRSHRWKGKAAQLNVIVDVQKSRDGEHNALFGMHKPSKILIFPCRDCTGATVLITFLHEIMHEWIFCYRPKLYSQDWTEELCEGAARHMFNLLGGQISAEKNCSKFRIDLPVGPLVDHTTAYQLLADFAHMSPDQLRAFGTEHTAK